MTRDEQIFKATSAMEGTLLAQGYSNQYAEAFADGFHEGAAWADPLTAWHDCRESMPEDTGPVLLCYYDRDDPEPYMSVGERDFLNDCWIIYSFVGESDCNVVAWMKLPEPPKFD